MDVFLAQDLTDVEKIPKQEAIESEITVTEASISVCLGVLSNWLIAIGL